jgi:hypothetical protein
VPWAYSSARTACVSESADTFKAKYEPTAGLATRARIESTLISVLHHQVVLPTSRGWSVDLTRRYVGGQALPAKDKPVLGSAWRGARRML